MKRLDCLKARAFFLIFLAPTLVSGCAIQNGESFAEIARAIAPELDPANGLPIAVLNEYRCDPGVEVCRPRDQYIAASPLDATVIAAPFSEAKGIPVVRYEDGEFPACPWHETGGVPSGLWAEFVRPPSIHGDSARVKLATVCMAGSGFEQVHEFSLHFDGREWKVVRRRLVSIT